MKKKKQILALIQVLIFFGGLASCTDEPEGFSNNDIIEIVDERMMQLGSKLENPFSIMNMQKAADNLKSSGEKDKKIKPSHLYVRFLPKNGEELNYFIDESNLELFDYPLDYEITKEGDYYHDPDIPSGEPTWLYTVVPIDYKLPKIKYEIIEECYIPDEVDLNLKSATLDEYNRKLEYEAYRITGNLSKSENFKSSQALVASNSPSGKIEVTNTNSGEDGVKKVKVRVHSIVKIDSDYTDASGNYSMTKSFSSDPHYGVIFENEEGFKIWGNWSFLAPAHRNLGWQDNEGYDYNFTTSDDGWKWATVNNAACDYNSYCNSFSVSKPPTDLRIWVFESSNWQGSAAMLRRTWGLYGFTTNSQLANFYLKTMGVNLIANNLANITKFAQPDITLSVDSNLGTEGVCGLTFHECAHASHWSKVGSNYWVKYINYIITYGAYGDGTGANAGYCGIGEMWGNYFGNYVCARNKFGSPSWWWDHGEDWFNPGFLMRVDNISDVNTSEIFSCLGSTNFSTLISQLKTKTNYDDNVDAAYNYYNDWP